MAFLNAKEKHIGFGDIRVMYIAACGFYCPIGNAFETMMKCAFSNQTNRMFIFYYGSMSNVLKVLKC